jgi:hypothetical protein
MLVILKFFCGSLISQRILRISGKRNISFSSSFSSGHKISSLFLQAGKIPETGACVISSG